MEKHISTRLIRGAYGSFFMAFVALAFIVGFLYFAPHDEKWKVLALVTAPFAFTLLGIIQIRLAYYYRGKKHE